MRHCARQTTTSCLPYSTLRPRVTRSVSEIARVAGAVTVLHPAERIDRRRAADAVSGITVPRPMFELEIGDGEANDSAGWRESSIYEVAGIGRVDSRDNGRLLPSPCERPLSTSPAQAYMSIGLHHLRQRAARGARKPCVASARTRSHFRRLSCASFTAAGRTRRQVETRLDGASSALTSAQSSFPIAALASRLINPPRSLS
jgi:hypothetical protein